MEGSVTERRSHRAHFLPTFVSVRCSNLHSSERAKIKEANRGEGVETREE